MGQGKPGEAISKPVIDAGQRKAHRCGQPGHPLQKCRLAVGAGQRGARVAETRNAESREDDNVELPEEEAVVVELATELVEAEKAENQVRDKTH